MARHNREGQGTDQRAREYTINYQPDWLRLVKVTRDLETGRQSTKTLFRNPQYAAEAEPGERVRTRIVSEDGDLDVEVTLGDPNRVVTRVRVSCVVPGEEGGYEEVEFTFEEGLAPPPPP